MELPAWLDGRLRVRAPALRDARGVFTTVRVEDGRPELVGAHFARLERDARALGLPWPPPWDPRRALEELAATLGASPRAVRVLHAPPHLVLEVREIEPWAGRALVDAPGRTAPPVPHGVKSTAREAYERLHAEARARGADEALVVAADGALVEGTRTNLFLALDGALVTPTLALGALPGVMRAALLTDLEREPLGDARGRTLPVRERALALPDLARAEEVILTSAVRLAVGLGALAGAVERAALPGAGGPVAAGLRSRALRVARGR